MFEYLRAYLQRRGKPGGQAVVICTCSAMSALLMRPLLGNMLSSQQARLSSRDSMILLPSG